MRRTGCSVVGQFESRLLTLKTRNSAAYKGVYALLMQSDCLDWIKHQPMNMASFYGYKIDIHHIFPKDWCASAQRQTGEWINSCG